VFKNESFYICLQVKSKNVLPFEGGGGISGKGGREYRGRKGEYRMVELK